MTTRALDLDAGPGAVPAGRRAAREALAGRCPEEVVHAGELVVTELLTNAVLHGGAPVRLAFVTEPGSDRVRVEVGDGSRVLPVRPLPSTDGMTGRGLALVDALAESWGVEPAPDGKVVWAELTPRSVVVAEPGDADLDELLAAFDDAEDALGPRRHVVALGDVPTELLLAAKAHVDSVVRELTLADTGAQSGVTEAVPASLAALVHDVVTEFAEARQAIKRQALAAAAQGRDRTTLRLVLPAEAAAAGERYLAALEEADAFGRASRLLTLAAPPQHAAFRRWYVTSLVDGLRRAAAGERAVVAPSFEAYLLEEVDHLAELQSVSDRAARLQRVTAALAGALDRGDVTRIVLDEAIAELGAGRGVVLLPAHRRIVAAATVGYPPAVADRLQEAWDADVVTPGRIAWETGRAVWVESREERDARYPDFAQIEPDAVATCAVPLSVAGHRVGVLRLSFAESRLFEPDERAFVEALGAVAAQALERADLYDARGTLAERLVRLQAVASALATTRSTDEVLDVAIDHATGLIGARVASISLVRDDGLALDLVRMVPPLPPDSPWWSFPVDADLPASEAVRTGRYLFVPSLRVRNARWPAIATASADFDHSFVVVPLHVEAATIGALTLSFPASEDDPAPSREFLVAFADACAQALQRARSAERAAEAGRQLAFLASASEELAGTLDIETTLGNLARLAVPHVADWCVLHLLQDGQLVCVAVEHADLAKRGLAVAAQQRWPATLDDPVVGSRRPRRASRCCSRPSSRPSGRRRRRGSLRWNRSTGRCSSSSACAAPSSSRSSRAAAPWERSPSSWPRRPASTAPPTWPSPRTWPGAPPSRSTTPGSTPWRRAPPAPPPTRRPDWCTGRARARCRRTPTTRCCAGTSPRRPGGWGPGTSTPGRGG